MEWPWCYHRSRPVYPLLKFVGFPPRRIHRHLGRAMVEPLCVGGAWIHREQSLHQTVDGQRLGGSPILSKEQGIGRQAADSPGLRPSPRSQPKGKGFRCRNAYRSTTSMETGM